ncbi:MAG: Ig-like domain repeat protein [Candidatus Acidiferrales bacterium]
MRNQSKSAFGIVSATVILLAAAVFTGAQTNVIASRITQAIDPSNLTILQGNTHPFAQAQFDRGAAPTTLPMQRMLLVLKRSAQQENTLDSLMEQQQDASSPNYHHWLTPQQYGQEFGPSDQDIQTVTSWLQSQGFQIDQVSNGRTVIEFSGTAAEVQSAFHTAIHQYLVNGESRWGNSSDPEIPTALTPVVAGIDTLYNFPRIPLYHLATNPRGSIEIGGIKPKNSEYTFPNPCNLSSAPFCNFALSPYDFATIYNIFPLWNQTPAIDGTGETIAIVGESDINVSDVESFQKFFGMTVKDPTIIMDGPDPGTVPGDETESDLDVEWAGAVAKGANIDLVVSQSTEASLGVDLSAQYAVDNNLAPVLSESYGVCEFFLGSTGNTFYNQLWQQAAAQGITVVVPTGDTGTATCDGDLGSQGPAQLGLSVNGIASTPYDVAMGGTDFNDLNDPLTYWNTTNSTAPGSSGGVASLSAKGYIPEMTWNDTCTNQEIFSSFGTISAAQTCNDPTVLEQFSYLLEPTGGGGGKSGCTVSDGQNLSSCTTPYSKPAWQTALTPADSVRDLPDVAMFASNGFNGSFYVVCEADLLSTSNEISVGGGYPSTSCDPSDTNTGIVGIGGTSAPTPAFAGIMALINQASNSRQGNANRILYKLAAQSGNTCSSAANPAGTCIFYDVPSGSTNSMPCLSGTPNCNVTGSNKYGVLYDGSNPAYNTGTGYDLATGLGSVNVGNLVTKWKSFVLALESSSTTLTLNSGNPVNITHGQSVPLSIAVAAGSGGTGTPSGSVSLIANTGSDGQQGVEALTLTGGSASGSTNALPGGTYTVFASYPGDGTFGASTSSPPVSVTVSPESSLTNVHVLTFNPITNVVTNSNATSFPYGSLYILRADITNSSGNDCVNQTTGVVAYGCPTGGVILKDNGNGIGSPTGNFPLNSQGYAEFQAVQLGGGTHALAGSYAGDSSYNPSSGTDVVTVTPAPTTTNVLSPVATQNVTIGQPFMVSVQAEATSSGVAPTGTFAFFDGSTQLPGTALGNGFTVPPADEVFINGSNQTTISGSSGPHTLTAHYSGDANYASSVSSSVSINALYPTTVSVAADPSGVLLGQNVTVTATVSTGNPASNASLKPTGAISFSSNVGAISGAVTTTTTQNASGDWIIQATTTITPQQTEAISATFTGDTNYASSAGSGTVTVTIPDFSVTPNPGSLTITAGQTGSTTLTITPMTSDTSTVTLSCYQTQVAEAPCTFTPGTVTLSNGASATATLSFSVPPPSSSLTSSFVKSRLSAFPLMPGDSGGWRDLGCFATLAGVLLALAPSRHRSRRLAVGLVCVGVLGFAVGCGGGGNSISTGGGSGGGSGGGGQTGPAITSTTLSTTSTKITPGAGATLTATVNSPNTITGIVNFLDASFPGVIAPDVSITGNTAQAQMTDTESLSADPGTHVITAQYTGDANNQESQSSGISIVVTGNTQQLVCGTTSIDQHCFELGVTVQ